MATKLSHPVPPENPDKSILKSNLNDNILVRVVLERCLLALIKEVPIDCHVVTLTLIASNVLQHCW